MFSPTSRTESNENFPSPNLSNTFLQKWLHCPLAAVLFSLFLFLKIRVKWVLLGAGKVLTKAHPCGFSLWNNLQEFERPLWSRDGTLVFCSDRVYTAWSDSGMDEGAVWTGRRAVLGHIWKEIILSVCFKLCEEPGGRNLSYQGCPDQLSVRDRTELMTLSETQHMR